MRLAMLPTVFMVVLSLVACSSEPPAPQPAETTTAAQSGDVHTFAIGGLRAVALRDGALSFPNDGTVFGAGQDVSRVSTLLTAAGLPTSNVHLSIQPLLVRSDDRVLLFDTGAGQNMGDSSGRLLASMAAAGVEPASVTDIFISHSHGDHVGGLVRPDGTLAFPNATAHISNAEWAFLKGMDAATASSVAITAHPALIAAITPKVAAFTPGAEILPALVTAVAVRGHTPGHSAYRVTSGEDSVLYVGDSLHHVVVSVQQPEWLNGFDADQPLAAQSRRDLVTRSADSQQRIHAVHFPFPGVGRIERRDDGFVWVAE